MTKRLSDFFNASRWIAALIVAIGHVRHLIFVESGRLEHAGLLWKGFYFVTGFGHEGVVVFFIVSGYLVGGLTMGKLRNGFDLRDYAIHRFSRIYIVLIPALLLCGALDLIGTHFVNAGLLYTESAKLSPVSMNFTVAHNLDVGTLLANLAMLEGTHGFARLGSNAPLWSLVYEWWYYVVFAAFAVAMSSRHLGIKAVAITLGLLTCVLLPGKIVMWGTIWIMGLAAALYGRSTRPKPPLLVGVGLFAVTLVLARLGHGQGGDAADANGWAALLRDLMVGTGFTGLLLAYHRPGERLPFHRLHERFAGFSYSLYLIHFPLLVFGVSCAYQLLGLPFGVQPGAYALVYLTSVVVVLFACAWLFSLVTEERTRTLRRILLDLTGGPVRTKDRASEPVAS